MRNRGKRWLSAALCVCMLVGLTACGGKEGDSQDNSDIGDSREEPVELTYCGTDVGAVGMEDSEVIDYLEEKLNIKLTFVEYTSDQWAAALSSGELPDIFQVNNTGTTGVNMTLDEIIGNGYALELTDLIEEYGPNIRQNIPDILDYMRTYRSNGTGGLYGLTERVPVNNPEGKDVAVNYGIGFLVRWDYYKEMGYPEITNEDELLDVLKKMQEAHPTTADGKPVYAFGGFNDWGLWPYFVPYAFQHGWMNGTGYLVGPDAEIQPMFGEKSDIFKKAMNFLNKASRMGLCDPEMFTMKNTDFIQKHTNLQYLCMPCDWWDPQAAEVQKEQGVMESDVGWRMIPGAFPEIYGGYPSRFGLSDRPTVISKNCEHPEEAMKLLDYLYSFEGSRLLMSGIKGVHWEEVDGKKEYTDEVIQEKYTNGTEFTKRTGIGFFNCMTGLADIAIDENGQYLDLSKTEKAIEASLDEADKAFSEHYGVEYPAQAYEAETDITYFNYEPINMMEPLNSDMQMISTQCETYYMTLAAELVNATSEEEFEEIWEKGCTELEAMGYNELMDAITSNVEAAREKLEKLGVEK